MSKRSVRGARRIPRLAAAAVLLAAAGAARGGGLTLYEIGSPDLGLAGAGYAARAQDAATVLTNPAGMTRLAGSEVQVAVQGLYGSVQFTPNALTSPSLGTNDGGNALGFLPSGSAFGVYSVSPDLKVGIGAFSNFGLSLAYDDAWVGRYYVQSATLLGLSVMPSVAYRVLPSLSVGLSANVTYGVLKDKVAVNGVLPSAPDGTLEVSAGAWGIGAELGVLFEPRKGTRIGATYSSPVSLDFKDTPSLTNVAGSLQGVRNELSLGVEVPQGVMLSAYHELTPALALLADVGWQDWSSFGKVDVQIANAAQSSATVNLSYTDTWHAALGAQLRASPAWLVSAGVAYDSTLVSDADRTATLPLGSGWRFGAGVQHPVSRTVDLGAAYELAWLGDLPLDQDRGPLAGRVAGTYRSANISVFALNVTWRP